MINQGELDFFFEQSLNTEMWEALQRSFIEQNEDPEQTWDTDCGKSAAQALTQEF